MSLSLGLPYVVGRTQITLLTSAEKGYKSDTPPCNGQKSQPLTVRLCPQVQQCPRSSLGAQDTEAVESAAFPSNHCSHSLYLTDSITIGGSLYLPLSFDPSATCSSEWHQCKHSQQVKGLIMRADQICALQGKKSL